MKRESGLGYFSVISVGILAACLILSACGTTRQAPGAASRSGFLGDYSALREGAKGEAQLIYLNPAAQWSEYDAILVDSVTIWRNERTDDVSTEDQQRLTDLLYSTLREELSKDYRIVDRPGPGVLRLRVALTEAQGAKVVMNAVTSIVPQLRTVTTLGGMASGTAVLVGKAGVEAEMVDSLSGERLMAAVDERQGTKAVRGGIAKWSDARLAFEYWAQRLRTRLGELRGA